MLKLSNFIKNEEDSDSRYICYNLNTSVRIFNYLMKDEELDEIYIYVSTSIKLIDVIKYVINYIDWFSACEDVLTSYYENKIGEKVYRTWFSEIEVYRIDFTFNDEYDYGATVYCGDRIYIDHSLEIDFDKTNILDIRLNG